MSYSLYYDTISKWSNQTKSEYYYLEKVLLSDSDFVISELKKDFEEYIIKIDNLAMIISLEDIQASKCTTTYLRKIHIKQFHIFYM